MTSNKKWHERNVKQVYLLIALAVAGAAALVWYVSAPEKGKFVSAYFVSPAGEEGERFTLEVAKTAAQREKGLMFRKKGDLPETSGMLFVFPDDSKRSFWMKNTYIPLDIIFINREGRVIGVAANTEVLSEKPVSVEGISRYVVELNGNVARLKGIVKGSQLKLEGGALQDLRAG